MVLSKLTFILFLCGISLNISFAQTDTTLPSVTVTKVDERELVSRTNISGTLVPRDDILISPEIEGLVITEILVDEGTFVNKGTVLAKLNASALTIMIAQNKAQLNRIDATIAQSKAQILEAEANKQQASNAYARTTTLLKSGSASADIYDQRVAASKGADARLTSSRQALEIALAERASAQATLGDTELKLARTELKASANGLVYRRNAILGALASASGEPLFRLIKDGVIELEGEVPELDIATLRQGQPALINVAGLDHEVKGKVRLVLPEIDKASRLGKLRVTLEKDPQLSTGAFARGNVETGRKKAITAPLSAVTYTKMGAMVQSVVHDKILSRQVQIGMIGDGRAEIISGLALGDVVVARAGTFVRNGDSIRSVLDGQEQTR